MNGLSSLDWGSREGLQHFSACFRSLYETNVQWLPLIYVYLLLPADGVEACNCCVRCLISRICDIVDVQQADRHEKRSNSTL